MNTDYSNVDFDGEYEELAEQVVIMAKVDGDFLPIRRTRAIRLIPGGHVVITSEVYRVERNGELIEEATAEDVVAKANLMNQQNQQSRKLPKTLGQALNKSIGKGNVTVQEDRSSHSESLKASKKR